MTQDEASLRYSLALIALDVALGTLTPAQGVRIIRGAWLDDWNGQDHETFRDACKLAALWKISPLDNAGAAR